MTSANVQSTSQPSLCRRRQNQHRHQRSCDLTERDLKSTSLVSTSSQHVCDTYVCNHSNSSSCLATNASSSAAAAAAATQRRKLMLNSARAHTVSCSGDYCAPAPVMASLEVGNTSLNNSDVFLAESDVHGTQGSSTNNDVTDRVVMAPVNGNHGDVVNNCAIYRADTGDDSCDDEIQRIVDNNQHVMMVPSPLAAHSSHVTATATGDVTATEQRTRQRQRSSSEHSS